MDPISLTLFLVATGFSVFSAVKERQTAEESGSVELQKQAEANYKAKLTAELSIIDSAEAIAAEKLRLKLENQKREKYYERMKLISISIIAVLVLAIGLKTQRRG